MKALINGKLILKNTIYKDKALVINKQIEGIIPKEEIPKESDLEIIDANDNYISPGFIDIHIHGAGGSDTMDGTIEGLNTISKTIIKNGVTGFLPTTMTMEMLQIHQALDTVRLAMNRGLEGAKILGVHLEGPFINEKYKGAQKADYVISPNLEYIKNYLDVVKIITMAPEIESAMEFIKSVQEENKTITLAIGHSSCTYEETIEAIDKGISHAAHIFNAMPPLHHRQPGIIGAIFSSNITCELIADKIHVHPALFKTLVKIKGIDRLVLISDSMRAGCMKDGQYNLGGQIVNVAEGSAKLEDGTLAGSILSLNNAVKNLRESTDISLVEAVKTVSLNPARVIGLEKTKGSIEIGKDSDLAIFNEEMDVKMSFLEGELKYENICS